ncbi:MAG: hypothetical protein AAGD01_14575 [Acidobacteriota bacterium]
MSDATASEPLPEPLPWHLLGAVPPRQLAEARLQLHWAIQAAAGVGKSLLPPADDDSHEAFSWLPQQRCFAQTPVDAERPFAAAVDPERLAFLLLAESGHLLSELPLGDMTLADARAWLEAEVTFLFGGSLPKALAEPANLGDHPLQRGSAFRIRDPRVFAELAHYYANFHSCFASTLFTEAIQQRAQPSPIRLWPHHLDLAVLLSLDDQRSVGVGLTPGDEAYDQPYLYVTPWPYPDADTLPQAPAPGTWHIDGWTGLVLRGESLVKPSSRAGQRSLATGFVYQAVALCLDLLEA